MTVGVFLYIYSVAYELFPANKNHAINTYNVKTLTLDNEDMVIKNRLSLEKMKDSFDVIFGFNSFNEAKYGNVMDNDFWKIEAFPWINDHGVDTSKPIKLKKCTKEDVPWIKVSLELYYKNALCIADKKMLEFQGDWFVKEKVIPFITISHCKGKSTCKSLKEAK